MRPGAELLAPLLAVAVAVPADARTWRHTSVKHCRVVAHAPDEAGYLRTRCPGAGGYAVERIEADGRSNLILLAPGGGERRLALPAVIDGGFGTVGDRIEWRGAVRGGRFVPDALVLRYAAQALSRPTRTISYLLTVRLDRGGACVTGRVAPGQRQNERARALADRRGACLRA